MYRQCVYETFQVRVLDMESAAVAHVAAQFNKLFSFFRSLSDLAGGDDADNVLPIFFGIAANNAVTTLAAFLQALPVDNASDADTMPVPVDHTPGENTQELPGVSSFSNPN